MKKANRKPIKLGGAVLIMVLTVMFVLIFLLAGTIAVVYSANNRAMLKYQESQAYYTARSILDTYIETMLADNTNVTGGGSGSDAIPYVHLNDDGTTTTSYNAKIGRALELDIYKLAVDLDNSTAGIQTSYSDIQSYLSTVGNSPDSPTDPTYEKVPNWVKLYILEIMNGTDDIGTLLAGADPTTANINAKLGASRLADSTGYQQACKIAVSAINPGSSDFPAGTADAYYDQFEIGTSDAVEYEVDNVTLAGYADDTSAGRMGKMFDYGTDVKLEVKLLERKYHGMVADGTSTMVPFFDRFQAGNREKDYVNIRITSTITYDGEEVSTSVEYKTKYDPKPSNDSALTALGGISSGTSGFSIAGGMTSLKPGTIALNAPDVSGSVFTEGSVDSQTSGTMKLVDNAHFVIKGDYQVSNALDITATGDKSFFYVGGKIHGDRMYTFGSSGSQPIDVIAGEFECVQNPYTVSGNLYTDTMHLEYGDSKVIPDIKGEMYANDIIIDAPNNVNGNKGKQNVFSVQDQGGGVFQVNVQDLAAPDVYAGRIIVKNYYTVDPDPSVVLDAEDIAKGITKLDLVLDLSSTLVTINNEGTATTLHSAPKGSVCIDYNNPDHFGNTLSAQFKKKITMPDGKEFELDTARTRFDQYYDESSFEQDTSGPNAGYQGDFLHSVYYTGDVIDEDKLKDPAISSIESAESQARKLTGGNTCVLSSAVTLSGNTTLGPGNYVLNAYTNQNANITVDTTNGNVTLQLAQGGGDYFGNFNVIGEGEFNLLIPEDGSTYSLGNSGYDFSVTYDKTNLSGGGTVYVGSETPGVTLTAPPQVNFYIGGESGLKVCRNSFVTGYVYGPRAKVEVVTDAQGRQLTYNQSGTTVSTSKYWLAGSVVCGEYSNNNVGVAFISSDQSNIQPGDKVFGWLDVLYTRPEAN